ncbi:MAG TPA: CDP-alcohol phosphatidyltransferase family protein [Candidatus Binatia bacterium]|jgi:phosphatidylcholine synthase
MAIALDQVGPPPGTLRMAAAWGVHLLTASGVVIAFLALGAAGAERFADAFRWLALAMFIDCIDGTLARAAGVKQVLPWFDGTKLDDIVDYLTYVVVPVVILHDAHMFPAGTAGIACAAAPLLASAYGFCRTDAKTTDHYFRGFPSYWNVFAFYALVLPLSPYAATIWTLALAALVFAPLKFLYPSRGPHFRTSSILLGAVWAVMMIVALCMLPHPPALLVWSTLLYPAYYVGVSLLLQATGRT